MPVILPEKPLLDDIFTWGGEIDGVMVDGVDENVDDEDLSEAELSIILAADDWRPFEGAKGGRGWQNVHNPSDVRYQEERPTDRGEGQEQASQEGAAEPPEKSLPTPYGVAEDWLAGLLKLQKDYRAGTADYKATQQKAYQHLEKTKKQAKVATVAKWRELEQEIVDHFGEDETVRRFLDQAKANVVEFYRKFILSLEGSVDDPGDDVSRYDREHTKEDVSYTRKELERALRGVTAYVVENIKRSGGSPRSLSLDAGFAFDIENRKAQGILNRALKAAKALSAQARRDLEAAFDEKSAAEAAAKVVSFLNKYRYQLTNVLSQTQLAALLEGAREVADHLPPLPPVGTAVPPPPTLPPDEARALTDKLRDMPYWLREEELYLLPADQQEYMRQALRLEPQQPATSPPSFTPPAPLPGAPEQVHFPLIEEAARELSQKNVVTRQTYDRLNEAVRQKAFTITGVDERETMEKIRDALSQNVYEGVDYESFKNKVLTSVDEGTFLSDGHLETIFRNNIQSAFSDGQMGVLKHPFVKKGFPYAAYHAIHDDRVRHDHLALEKHGIGNTNVYRIDDPVFETFRPPWDFNDRCSWVPLTIRMAAEQGILEAKEWLSSGTEPSPPARVPMPPFEPLAAFRRDIQNSPLAVQLSLESLGNTGALFAAEDWRPFEGAKGGRGWQNVHNPSDVRYQEERPTDRGEGQEQTSQQQATSQKAKPVRIVDALSSMKRKVNLPWLQGEVDDPIAQSLLRGDTPQQLQAYIDRHGATELTPLGSGAGNVVFGIGGGRVVRIGNGDLADIPNIPEMLQRIDGQTDGHTRMEIFPLVSTKGISQDDVDKMALRLAAKGYEFSDPGTDNLGRTREGQLVVIDPGAIAKKRASLSVSLSDRPHAPPSGRMVNGKFYKAGQFLPDEIPSEPMRRALEVMGLLKKDEPSEEEEKDGDTIVVSEPKPSSECSTWHGSECPGPGWLMTGVCTWSRLFQVEEVCEEEECDEDVSEAELSIILQERR